MEDIVHYKDIIDGFVIERGFGDLLEIHHAYYLARCRVEEEYLNSHDRGLVSMDYLRTRVKEEMELELD